MSFVTHDTKLINPFSVFAKPLFAYNSGVQSSCILPKQTTNSFWATSMPTTCLTIFLIPILLKNKSENLPSFCLLVGYSGYNPIGYSLHSVQTRRDKKG